MLSHYFYEWRETWRRQKSIQCHHCSLFTYSHLLSSLLLPPHLIVHIILKQQILRYQKSLKYFTGTRNFHHFLNEKSLLNSKISLINSFFLTYITRIHRNCSFFQYSKQNYWSFSDYSFMKAKSHSFRYLGFPRIQTFHALSPISTVFQIIMTHSSFLQAVRRIRKVHATIVFLIASNYSSGCPLIQTIKCLAPLSFSVIKAALELTLSSSFI